MKKILLFLFAVLFALLAIGSAVAIWDGGITYLSKGISSMLFESFFAVIFGVLAWKA